MDKRAEAPHQRKYTDVKEAHGVMGSGIYKRQGISSQQTDPVRLFF